MHESSEASAVAYIPATTAVIRATDPTSINVSRFPTSSVTAVKNTTMAITPTTTAQRVDSSQTAASSGTSANVDDRVWRKDLRDECNTEGDNAARRKRQFQTSAGQGTGSDQEPTVAQPGPDRPADWLTPHFPPSAASYPRRDPDCWRPRTHLLPARRWPPPYKIP